ncbi:unnamed protein product [Parnassius apollo]|uniref:(apollo) hypothetical protein n=1 Tax=Parnassius apollo TaxID=110799 RepID=A0A8S3W8B3_PARAO|nr:unnamed protein product [Parnassius apollo]
MDTIMRLTKEKVDAITVQEWKNVCDHAVKEEKVFDCLDAAIDGLSERFIINTGSDESSDESEDEDAMSGEEEL